MNQSYGTSNVGFDPGVVNGTAPITPKAATANARRADVRRAGLSQRWQPVGEWIARSVVYYGILMGLFAFCMAGVLIRSILGAKDGSTAFFYFGMLLVFAGWGVFIMYRRVVLPFIETSQFVEWKKTPEGALWVQSYLHQKPWDPQNPVNLQRAQAAVPPMAPVTRRTAGSVPNLFMPPR